MAVLLKVTSLTATDDDTGETQTVYQLTDADGRGSGDVVRAVEMTGFYRIPRGTTHPALRQYATAEECRAAAVRLGEEMAEKGGAFEVIGPEPTTVTLNDYANDRAGVVLFAAGVGSPTGDYFRLGSPDDDYADRRGLLDLPGEIDVAGDWRWTGEGKPTDDRANSITKLHAYVDAAKWGALEEEYNAAG